jgi:hypothetical protein
MASTYSTSLKLELIGQGEQSGTWGLTTNNNLGALVEQAITGVQTISMANTTYTLTSYDGAVDEARNAVLVLSGTNYAPQNLIAPAVEKVYIVNNISGNTVNIKTSSGNAVAISNSVTTQVYCDGTNFYSVAPSLNNVTGNFAATGNITAGGNLYGVNETLTGNLNVAGTITAGSISGITGRIVQIVSAGFSGAPQTTSGGQVGTNHYCNITPTSASSKILVLYFGSLAQANIYAGNGADAFLNMCRNGGALFSGQNMGRMNINTNMGNGSIYGSVAWSFVDSPGSTALQSYQIYYSCDGGGVAEYNSLGSSTITLLEISQ